MLTPLVFVVCEKVILDKAENPTLIVLLNEVHVSLPADGSPLPPDAVSPKEWAVFAMWNVEQEDFGRDFIQHTKIVFEDGTVFHDRPLNFKVKPHTKLATNTANIVGMPIGRHGKILITIWLDGDSRKYTYPVHIVHDRPQTPDSLSGLAGVRRA